MTDKNSDDDDNTRDRIVLRKYLPVILTATMMWIGIFLVVGSALPFMQTVSDIIDNVAYSLGSSRSSLIVAAIVASYFSISLIIASNARFRRSLLRILYRVPGSRIEESAYGNLRPGEMPRPSDEEVGKAISAILNRVADLEERPPEFRVSDQQTNEIRNDVVQIITEKISRETSEDYHKKVHQEVIDHLETSSLRRLSDLSVVLGSRARLTLWMGVIVCGGGIYALYLSLFKVDSLLSPDMISSNWLEFAANYVPRLSLVVLVELIGLFFLKLYKATLSEIRFVQNEITNVEMKLIALHGARSSTPDVLASIIGNLAATERNSIIDKGQTTVEIEQSRLASEADRSVLEAVVSLLHGTERASFWRGRN